MDLLDYRSHQITKNITARVFIWDIRGTQRLIRDQDIQLSSDHATLAFHPSGDRTASFDTVYHLNSGPGTTTKSRIFRQDEVRPDVAANCTSNIWQISFGADGRYFTSSLPLPPVLVFLVCSEE
jgi:hypothetical protein